MKPVVLKSLTTERIGLIAIIGGGVIVLGTWLSWFSLFAGLQSYRGIDLVHGRILAAGGALSALLGVCCTVRRRADLRWAVGLLGFALLAFASWAGIQLRVVYHQLSADPFLVARLGPGLAVVIGGAVLVVATLFVNE